MEKGVDHIGVCVVFFCHDGKGNFVMAKRGKNTRDDRGRWDIGGGGIEHGEAVHEALRKEIREEYGVSVASFEFLGFRDVHREHENKKTHWIALDFKVLVDPREVRLNEPHKFDEIKWFTFGTVPPDHELHSQLPIFFKNYRGRLG